MTRRPAKCPQCGDPDNIGWLDSRNPMTFEPINADTDEEYEEQGGRYYCVSCGWGEEKGEAVKEAG